MEKPGVLARGPEWETQDPCWRLGNAFESSVMNTSVRVHEGRDFEAEGSVFAWQVDVERVQITCSHFVWLGM